MIAKKTTDTGKSVVRAYGLRKLEPGEFEIQMSEGARPFCVRDDGGQLKIYAIEDPGRAQCFSTFTLLGTAVPVDGYFDDDKYVGSAMVSGSLWHVFRGSVG